MAAPQFSFEVKVLRDKRWVVDRIFDSELLATKHARELVQAQLYERVQVARERERNGTFTSKVVFDQACDPRKDPPVSIVPIDDAPDCASVDDLYGLEARLTMWRVLRKYFDQVVLSPSEILHNYTALAKLMDNDPPVYPSAVDRIATIQARRAETDPKERRDELYRWMDEVAYRAREAEREKALRRHSLADFPAMAEAALEWGGPGRRDHLIRCTIARQFYTTRNWLAKLEALLTAATADLSRDDLAILDGFIADILGSASVIQELLGSRSNLCAALIGLIDLMEGKEETSPPADTPEVVQVLRRLFADGTLPCGATVLMDRVKVQIAGRQPLSRNDPSKEIQSLGRLIARMSGIKGIMGGAEMAEALTGRASLSFNAGGATGRKLGVGQMLTLIRDPVQKIRYLITIAETETGTDAMEVICSAVRSIADQATDIHSVVPPGLSSTKKMMTITDLQRALMASNLPPDFRDVLFGRLDDLLAEFVERDGFIDRLDDPNVALRERATRLVKFCSSGILFEGKAMQIARARIAQHLRQPNFIEKFCEGATSKAEAEILVRDFHRALADAGFAG